MRWEICERGEDGEGRDWGDMRNKSDESFKKRSWEVSARKQEEQEENDGKETRSEVT